MKEETEEEEMRRVMQEKWEIKEKKNQFPAMCFRPRHVITSVSNLSAAQGDC